MQLSDYLTRIGYAGPLAANYETLAALHQAHLLAIPYENLDIHLGRYLSLDEGVIFEKLVTARRGGWCYEMNGLFAWALREIGFSVALLASAVDRASQGKRADGDHLILRVVLDRPYLVDIGFGNAFLTPLPLEPGVYTQGFLNYQLTHDGGIWCFQNHAYGGPGYEFTETPHLLADFAAKCHELQTSPESGFVRTTVCHRFTTQGQIGLRGAVLCTLTSDGMAEQIIEDEATYRRVLNEQFALDLPATEIASLWNVVWPKHLEWLQAQNAANSKS